MEDINKSPNSLFHFGEIIPDLVIKGKSITVPVFNDREVRATAGVMLFVAVIAFVNAYFKRNFSYLNFAIITFFIEFFLKVVISPNIAPYSILGKWIVRKQTPDYVSAHQKRFAWSIGLAMSFSMIFIGVIFKIRGILPLSMCSICMLFMWLETSFGICAGCHIYLWFVKVGIIKSPDKEMVCSGGSCST